VNLNHCWTAQQLLLQTVAELDTDVIIVSDYYRTLRQAPRWVSSSDNKCGLYVTGGSTATVLDQGSGDGYARAKVGGKLFYNCYCTPNCTTQEFDRFLGGLEISVGKTTAKPARSGGWSVKQLSPATMKEHWDRAGAPRTLPRNATTEEHVESLQDYLTQACDAAMPARSTVRGKRAVHWWSKEISELRKKTIAARRSYQRAGADSTQKATRRGSKRTIRQESC